MTRRREQRTASRNSPDAGVSRRRFVAHVATAGAVAASGGAAVLAQPANRVRGFDHVALPMQNTDAMLAFYRGLGFDVRESAAA